MSRNSSLSGEEVSALMHELGEQKAAADSGPAAAKPYTFGSEAMRPMAALPALDRMSERMARRLRDTLEPLSRVKPRVTADAVTVRRFESWRAAQPEFTSLSLYRFRPLKGGVLVGIEPEFVSRLVDAFYGGSGASSAARAKEFTPTEERLLGRLTEIVTATLVEVWAEVLAVKPQLSARETNIAYASLVRGDEPVAIARFAVSLGQGRPSAIEILYPIASLRAVEGELSAKVHDDGGMAGDDWRQRLGAALGEVRIEARSVLARPSISVAELLQLKTGDVIPISVPAMVPLIVGGRTVALGTIGDQDGHAALKVEKMEDGSFR